MLFFHIDILFLKNRKISNNRKIHSFLLFAMIMRNKCHNCPISPISHFVSTGGALALPIKEQQLQLSH
jgi:hypothetical protein